MALGSNNIMHCTRISFVCWPAKLEQVMCISSLGNVGGNSVQRLDDDGYTTSTTATRLMFLSYARNNASILLHDHLGCFSCQKGKLC